MTDKEMPCDLCLGTTYQSCEVSDQYPIGVKQCSGCGGTGLKSIQSVQNIYKAKEKEMVLQIWNQ